MATPRLHPRKRHPAPAYAERRIVAHHDDDRLREELYTIVDLGGAAIDVTVEHSIYGQITAPLHIFSRYDADAFCGKLEHSKRGRCATSRAASICIPCARRTKGRSTA